MTSTPAWRNACRNALHAIDAQLGRLVEALERAGVLGEAVLVVMRENGEAFHEGGRVTHAGGPFESMLRVGCVVHAPRWLIPGDEDYPFSLVELVPTILGRLG